MDIREDITFHRRFRDLYERACRRDRKTTKAKFAESCGITRWQLAGYLSGRSEPVASNLKKIAEKQQVSVSWLVGESDIPRLEVGEMLGRIPPSALDELYILLNYCKYRYENK